MGKNRKKNELEREGKITEKDVGFGEDSFEQVKQLCGDESHCLGNFVINPIKINLDKLNSARRLRTIALENVITSLNAKIDDQNWCRLKHICSAAMHTQELIARHSCKGNIGLAKEFSQLHKELYVEYLKILGINEKNIKSVTSA